MDSTKLTAYAAIIVAIGGLVTPWISAWLRGRAESRLAAADAIRAGTEEEQSAISAYRGLVVDLRAECERLHGFVTDLQAENLLFKAHVDRLEKWADRVERNLVEGGIEVPPRPMFNGAMAR